MCDILKIQLLTFTTEYYSGITLGLHFPNTIIVFFFYLVCSVLSVIEMHLLGFSVSSPKRYDGAVGNS